MTWLLIALLLLGIARADDYEEEETLHLPRDLSRLELTPRQREAIGTILARNMEQLHRLHEERERLQKHLRALFLRDSFDRRAFEEALLESKRKAVAIEGELFARIHALLTPEQRRRFVRHMKEWEIE
jgi:Spy/CpxP family protein refolding chaperone